MSFKNYPVSALTLSTRGHIDIIKMSQQAGYTSVLTKPLYQEKERESAVCVFTHMHANTSTHKGIDTPAKLMRWKWLITPHLFHHWDTLRLCTITYTHRRVHYSLPDTFLHTHLHCCLGTQTVLHCLFMKSFVCTRQAGDEHIYSVLLYGHIFNIINLFSNLPSALPTHLVIL